MDEIESGSGAVLGARRNALRMTQDHLAVAAGVSRSTIQRAERGLPISHENARSICAVLEINPVEVTGVAFGAVPAAVGTPMYDVEAMNRYRWKIIGNIVVGLTMALSSVLVFGPYVQDGMAKIGHPSPEVQRWSESVLAYVLGAIVIATPFAMMSDERRAMVKGDGRADAYGIVAALSLTAAGCLMFATTIVPMLLATTASH